MKLNKYINNLAMKAKVTIDYDTMIIISEFFEDNNWFNNQPNLLDGVCYLSKEQEEQYRDYLLSFLRSFNNAKEENYKLLNNLFMNKMPATSGYIIKFFDEMEIDEESRFYIISFLLHETEKDLFLFSDKEIGALINKMVMDLTKKDGDILTFFITWLKENTKTKYVNDYVLSKRSNKTNVAYTIDEYLKFLYCFFNDEYITKNKMYEKAAESKGYADTWLYLSLHFVCACRDTDLVRIPYPILSDTPENILTSIKYNQFSEESARNTLYSITWRLNAIPLVPNKTKNYQDIPSIKFIVPESCEVHLGKLFAICEAHRQLTGIKLPLIQQIKTYQQIDKYMGNEIGQLFKNSNFSARAANKAYLQSIEMLADDILENESIVHTKGYILAALARSHKGDYGEFASTTATYLKDSAFNGLTPEFVAMELFERGVLSFIPSMLLKIVTKGEYEQLSASKQTALIKSLDMSPNEIESLFGLMEKQKDKSQKVVNEIIKAQYNQGTILNALHMIGSGTAFSKQTECMCILTAFGKICQYDNRNTCIGCDYEISTKSTLFLIISEYNRMNNLYHNSKNELEKNKYKTILKDIILPALDEMLTTIEEQYGKETYIVYENLIKENIL